MIRLVAFDLDGTIGDTIPLCLAAFREATAACFMAVERMLKEELLPVPGVLNAARELILQMKKDKADGRSSGAAIEKFLDEVKPIKN